MVSWSRVSVVWVGVAAAALETRGRMCCLTRRGGRGPGRRTEGVNSLHLPRRAGSCIALAGTEHLTGPQVNAVDTHGRNRPVFSDSSLGLLFQTVHT